MLGWNCSKSEVNCSKSEVLIVPSRRTEREAPVEVELEGFAKSGESQWGRHPILDRVGFLQLHESQAGYSGSNFLPVKRESFGEDRSLDHLTLLQVSLGPKASRVCYEMLGKPWMPSTSNASIFAS